MFPHDLDSTTLTAPPALKLTPARMAMVAAIATVASVVVLYFFCPRFLFFPELYDQQARPKPEHFRAKDELRQLDDPFATTRMASNRVIRWRLLFPVAAYLTGMPANLYFALPHLGCLMVMGLMAWIVWRRTLHPAWALTACCLLAQSGWFFVSTGWLGYFDSWVVLALLLVAFEPRAWLVAVSCALAPWVDERFLLLLPLAICVRLVDSGTIHGLVDLKRWSRSFLPGIALPAASYLALRAMLSLSFGDRGSGDYLEELTTMVQAVPFQRFLEGLWSAYRVAWLLLIPALWPRRGQWRSLSAGTAAIALLSISQGLVTAADMSRSISMILPLMLLGFLRCVELVPRASRIVLPALVVINLALPANHAVWSFLQPIRGFPLQYDAWKVGPLFK